MGKGKAAPCRHSSPWALLCAGALVGIALCGMYSYAFCGCLPMQQQQQSGVGSSTTVEPPPLALSAATSVMSSPASYRSSNMLDALRASVFSSGINSDLLDTYLDTIRSCLGGSSYCFDEKVRSTSETGVLLDRIGLLAVPLSGETFVKTVVDNLMASTAAASSGTSKGDSNSNIKLVVSSNVPAYGYGKNHGWTRIIRLTRRLLPHALALLHRNSSSNLITNFAFATQVRQIVRWNCRLSHVAAHTKMLTVFTEDLLQRPMVEMEKILTFAGIRFARTDLQRLLAAAAPALHADTAVLDISSSSELLYRGGLAALEEELTSSKNLTRWPCASFSELDRLASSAGAALPLSAKQLAPVCDGDGYVKCSVPVDTRGG